MMIRLFKWCDHKAITLVPVLLPGVHNIQADSLFRVGQTLSTEGTMAMERLRPVFASGASRRSTCLRHSPTDDSSSCIGVSRTQGRVHGRHVGALGTREGPPVCFIAIQDGPSITAEENIRTPGSSSWTPCWCPGTTGRASCLLYHHSRWSLKYYRRNIRTPGSSWRTSCRCPGTMGGCLLFDFPPFKMVPQVLQKIAQSPGVRVILIAPLQQAASWVPELMDLAQEDPILLFVEGQDLLTQDLLISDGVTETRHYRPSNLHAWKLYGPSWGPRAIPGKLLTWCQGPFVNHHSRCMNPIGQDLCPSVGRKDGTCFESEVIISAPIWCICSEMDFSQRR